MKLNLIPAPKKITYQKEGVCILHAAGYMTIDDRSLYPAMAVARAEYLSAMEIALFPYPDKKPQITVKRGIRLKEEGYRLTIDDNNVTIEYKTARGAFYGMMTLNQMLDNNDKVLPYLTLTDWPDYPTRGYMLDIGRNKVPKLSEIEHLIDKLAAMKINHVELYIEGIPFAYHSFPQMWENRDIMRGDEVMALDEYCKARFIEFVPTQNHFGHMDNWLFKEYRHLAECPDGFHFGGSFFPNPRCLNPLDPGSLALVQGIADDFLPYFTSKKYNVSCDETLELGQGASKEQVEKVGKGRVYLDFLMKIYAIAKKHGKQMLFWDDIIKDFPELLPELPGDVIALEWGYNPDQPSEESCAKIAAAKVPFYVCPGTAAWNTLLGKTSQMKANIRNAAERGLKYGACGLLNTDWGDCGHLQSIATSYAGITYGAAMAWGPKENVDIDLAEALNVHIFHDAAGKMGQFVLELGDYYLGEGKSVNNITYSFLLLISGLDAHTLADGVDEASYSRVYQYIADRAHLLDEAKMGCYDADAIVQEYKLAMRVIQDMQTVGLYHKAAVAGDKEAQKKYLTFLLSEMDGIMDTTKTLWLARNHYSYLRESLAPYETIKTQAEAKLKELQ